MVAVAPVVVVAVALVVVVAVAPVAEVNPKPEVVGHDREPEAEVNPNLNFPKNLNMFGTLDHYIHFQVH